MELETFDLASSLLKKLQSTLQNNESIGKKDLKIAEAINSLGADFRLTEAQKKKVKVVLEKAYTEPEAAVFGEGDEMILKGCLVNIGIKTELTEENVNDLLLKVSKLKSKVVNDNRKALFTKAKDSLSVQGKEVTAEALVELSGLTLKEAQKYLKTAQKGK